MHSLLKTSLSADFIFYRRNRLLALIGVFFVFIWVMAFIPTLLFDSSSIKFELVQRTLIQAGWFINIFVAALGVLIMSHHLSHRCLKMVITKPCPMETWVLSKWLSALLVSAALHLMMLLAALILFLAWHIPFQTGLLFVVVDSFLRSVLILSVIIALTALIHPFVAVLVMLVFGADSFYGLTIFLSAMLESATNPVSHLLLRCAKAVCYGLYWILPVYTPFKEETRRIYSSLRMTWGDLSYLGLTFIYGVVLGLFFYFLTVLVLKRRRLT